MKTTLLDLMGTLRRDPSEVENKVICPACGNKMDLLDVSSYRMKLSEKARHELNRAIEGFRTDILQMEAELARRNTVGVLRPPIDEGLYAYKHELKRRAGLNPDGTYGRRAPTSRAGEMLATELDVFESRNIYSHDWPTSSRYAGDGTRSVVNAGPEQQDRVFSVLIRSFERASKCGPLLDMVFDQLVVSDWVQEVTPKPWSGQQRGGDELLDPDVLAVVAEVTPHYAAYLADCQSIVLARLGRPGGRFSRSSADTGPTATPDEARGLIEGIARVRLSIALLLGHLVSTDANTAKAPVGRGAPFELPRNTYVVNIQRLQDLLSSHVVMRYCDLRWAKELVDGLSAESGRDDSADAPGVTALRERLEDDLEKLLSFTCTGFSGMRKAPDRDGNDAVPELAEDAAEDAVHPQERVWCGWDPKREPTSPVVLLGSPGAGKSMVMLTGLVSFADNVASMGATVSFARPEDRNLLRTKRDEYTRGIKPKPTDRGTRESIHLTVTRIGEGDRDGRPDLQYSNFVFTDIAGEMFTSSLTHAGTSSALTSVLGGAETIVFLFDMLIEDAFREDLVGQRARFVGNEREPLAETQNIWTSRLGAAYRTMSHPRLERRTQVSFSQVALLNQLLDDIRTRRQVPAGERIPDLNLICVLPKADLYADFTAEPGDESEHTERLFMTGFFRDLEARRLLFESTFDSVDGYLDNRRSAGGLGSTFTDGQSLDHGTIIETARHISDRAREAIERVDQAFYHDNPRSYPEAMKLRHLLAVSLVRQLRSAFDPNRVFFLPVCAQGTADENVQEGTERPFNPKLAEFVFLLPVALSIAARAGHS